MAFGLGDEETRATPANMEVYVRLAESAASSGETDADSSQGSLSLSRSGHPYENLNPNPQTQDLEENQQHHQELQPPQQQQQQQQQQQPQQRGEQQHGGDGAGAEPEGSGRSGRGAMRPMAEARQQQQQQQEIPKLRRREGMSDLWQNQGAFRSNRKSMKNMFQEFAAELECAANEHKAKAEVGDVFSYTTVGIKHLVRDAPSEDRVAIHPAVVPTIDEKDKEDLEIDTIDTTPFAMFGVFDGHGGPACAEFLTQSVSTVLAHSPVLYDEDLTPIQRRARATADSFEELEKVHNDWAHKSGDLSGSTAILSTFQDGVLVMAAVGDSAALYVDHMGKTHNLCPQHSTSNKREVERVLSMGGTIINNRVAGCLMPTRTIGDLDCKRELGGIVSPHPELQLAAVYAPPDDGDYHDEPFLVLASDGLWDVLSNAEVAFITRRGLRLLRARERKQQQKEEKAAAKAAQKAATASATKAGDEAAGADAGGGDGGGDGKKSRWKKLVSSSRRSSRGGSSSLGIGSDSFPGSNVLPQPEGLGGPPDGGQRATRRPEGIGPMDMSKNGLMDGTRPKLMDGSRGGYMDGSRTAYGLDGSRMGYLDNSIRGLSASVRGGLGSVPIMAASLDSSMYAGLRAQEQQARLMDDNLCEVQEGVPATVDSSGFVIPAPASSANAFKLEGDDFVVGKELTVNSTEQAASVRSAGSAAQNVAMLLAQAALRAQSQDDISVVVVTFTGTEDKSAPGSRNLQRKGSIRNIRGMQR